MTRWYEIENANEIASPGLLVYPDRIEANLRAMVAWSGDPFRLRPHVKTHKSPHVVRMKLAAGITKFKASTIAEVEMTADAGGRDILLSYQPVGPNCERVALLAKKYPDLKLSTIVDDSGALAELSAALERAGVRVSVLIDLDVGMHRTGIAPNDDAFALYASFADHPGVLPGGIHAYDGHLHQSDYQELCEAAESTFQSVWEFRDRLEGSGHPVPTIVTSGTCTSMFLAQQANVEVSAGTTVLWDRGYETICPQYDFQHAAVVIARVISKPQDDLLCVDLGYKAVAAEGTPPHVHFFGLEDADPVSQNEEHLVLRTDRASEYPVGSVLYGIPRHICPTVALQQEAWCVRDGRAVEAWPIVARDRRITI